jgi:Ca-activated chloride channel homolog
MQSFYFYLILLLPFVLYFYIKQEQKNKIDFKYVKDIKTAYSYINIKLYFKMFLIFLILLIFIIILSDPHKANIKENIKKNGIDIVLVLDISKSMEANDLKPSRIEKAKSVIATFVKKQKTNRL